MSNPNQPDNTQDDALAALHGLGNDPEPAEHEEQEDDEAADPAQPHEHPPEESHDDPSPSSNASGFVGMLAKEGSPVPLTGSGALRSNPDEIKMAREIAPESLAESLPQTPAAARPAAKRPVKKAPDWYHVAVPIMYTLGVILILIGIWAVGALLYMALSKPTISADVHYPAITWHFDEDTEIGAYTFWSKVMPAIMLICIPVALAMAFMARMMQKQIRIAQRAAAK